jgi:DNA-directed RNA polymerase specialized sigma24 family protein
MVCRNEEKCGLVLWDDKNIYGFVIEPTKDQKKLLNAVNKLPIICRKIVILYAFKGMQRQEIAAMMAMSPAAIRFLIHRSGLLLQEYLSENNHSRDFGLKTVFSDWPYMEYAKLAEMQKNMVLFE